MNDTILIINLNEINANKTTATNKKCITVQYKTTATMSHWGDPCSRYKGKEIVPPSKPLQFKKTERKKRPALWTKAHFPLGCTLLRAG